MKRVKQAALFYSSKTYCVLQRIRQEEKGAQAIEWVLLALVVIALMAGISKFFQNDSNTEGLAKALLGKLQKWVEDL